LPLRVHPAASAWAERGAATAVEHATLQIVEPRAGWESALLPRRDGGVTPVRMNGSMAGPTRRLPPQAQIARGMTFLQAVPVTLAAAVDLIILMTPGARPAYPSDRWFIGGGLALAGLAVISAARLRQGRRWAWSGTMAANVATALAWTAATVWIYLHTAEIDGTDGGMLFVSMMFLSLPMIAISATAIGLLCAPSVLRCCLTRPDPVGRV
jgi:hypothetical protein